jgi:hypothetical protein
LHTFDSNPGTETIEGDVFKALVRERERPVKRCVSRVREGSYLTGWRDARLTFCGFVEMYVVPLPALASAQ